MAAAALVGSGGGKSPMAPGDCGRCIDKRCCCCCSNCAEGDVLSAANTLGVLVDEFLLPERSDRRRSADARIDDGADDELAEAGCAVRGVDCARAGDRGGGGPRTLLPTGSMTDAKGSGAWWGCVACGGGWGGYSPTARASYPGTGVGAGCCYACCCCRWSAYGNQ